MDLLERAREIIQQRQKQYGPPTEHHAATAKVWTALLRKKLRPGVEIEAGDIAILYAGDKLVRETNEPREDNRLDVCGYMACREAILTSTERTEMDEAETRGILRRVGA